jgi:L-ascorbate metabolism protein UlaG (beta-lactamase superfamily)
MSVQKYYLKPNARLEPLYNQWYAWQQLIAPVTAAMNIANAHVKIMRSFTSSPEIHVAAMKNPLMRGGPFIDLPSSRVGDVKSLLERTVENQSHMIEFAAAVKKLNEILTEEAKGQSLEPLYEKIPGILRGYVELVYDLNRYPSVRFIEGLLYKSPYYDSSLQAVDLSLVDEDYRPFVFSTPRFEDENHLQAHKEFSDPALDELFMMRYEPKPFAYIKDALQIEDRHDDLFSALLTEELQPSPSRYLGDSIRIRYFGHACILVETKETSILTDPLVSYRYPSEVPRYSYSDLPETIDYVLLTHTHQDHVLFEHLLQLRHKIRTVVVPRSGGGALEDPSLKLALLNTGFKNVIEIDDMETIPIPGGSITALPFFGEHGDLNIRTKAAHLICLAGKSILCAADSNDIEPKLYERLHELMGDLDILFLGMECDGAPMSWLYGQLFTKPLERKWDQSRRTSGSDFPRALDIVRQLNCKRVYVYAMGQEPWLTFVTSIQYTEESKPIVESNRLVEACRGMGIESERLFGHKELFV